MPSRTIFTTSFEPALGVDADVDLLAERLELLDGGGAVDVGGDQERRLLLGLSRRASLAAVVVLPEPWSPTSRMTVGGTVA